MDNDFRPIVGSYPNPTPEQLAEAQKMDHQQGEYLQKREDSWDRSDTDGFLSQWAHGIHADLKRAEANILRHGGCDLFWGLFVRNQDGTPGRRIRAVLKYGDYGPYWAICDQAGKFTGKFFPAGKTLPDQSSGKLSRGVQRSKIWQAGLIEAYEWAPARAFIDGEGRGLSGRAWVAVKRTDRGYPTDAIDLSNQ